jgi:hypothetical protein
MSAETDFSTRPATVLVGLLDEGTDVWRPVPAIPVGRKLYVLIRTADYDPEDETWAFPPGAIVRCRREVRDGKEVIIAVERVGLETALGRLA